MEADFIILKGEVVLALIIGKNKNVLLVQFNLNALFYSLIIQFKGFLRS